MANLTCAIDDAAPIELRIERLMIAGWAGRDHDEVEHHIAELAALGVKRPASVPCFYEVAASLLTTGECIEVVGTRSSGEAEVVLIQDDAQGLFVGIGSDHTDRNVESYDVAASKQMCAKPLGGTLWRYADVAAHWDTLIARSWRIGANGERVRYQEGTLARLLPPARLLELAFDDVAMPHGTVLFCGTQPVIGGVTSAHAFEVELHDPVKKRSLWHRYAIAALAHVA